MEHSEHIHLCNLRNFKKVTLWVTLFLAGMINFNTSLAEGTKELAPTIAEFNKSDMHIFDVSGGVTRDFMTYIAPEDHRLNFEICNPGEEVYFGFNFLAADLTGCNTLWYRIKDPLGNIVFGPQQVTNAGAGSIGSHAQALIGPNNLVGGAGGYTPLSFTPTMPGSFYIEFNPNNPNSFVNNGTACVGSLIGMIRIPLFDITVADAPNGNKIPGRLWSKAWDLITNSFTNPFKATMYVYADDGIVTSINFNSIQPNGFIISCNRTGVTNTGNFINDRKSVAGNVTYPQYKIFLNNPDENCFPTGAFGSLTGAITVTGCDQNNRCINVPVDKAGDCQIILDLNGVAGFQPGTADRLLSAVLTVGNNCIPWDSRDGLGNLVATGTNIPIQLDYFNGLTNLPMYDVENHPNGYIVNLVRPAGPQPKLFFDDSNIPGGTVNLTGCTPGVPPLGCHRWSGNKAPDGVTNPPGGKDWGNVRTINTWWYANILTSSANYNVASILVDANTTNPPGQANNTAVCGNQATLNLTGSVSGATTTGTWSIVTGGGSLASATSPTGATYTFAPADLVSGSVKLILTSTGNGACPAVVDTLFISIQAGPTVNAGGPVTRCSNSPVVSNLGGSFTVATGVQWTGGTAANFTPNTTTATAQYTPTPAEIAAGSVTLTLTTTGNGICPAAVDTKTITFTPAPSLTMGPNVSVCANNSVANITATATNAASVLWTGGGAGSTFGNATSANTTFTPSAALTAAAPTSTTLTLTASQPGCADVTGTLNVAITPTPVVNAGPNRTICANDSINLVGTLLNAPTATWSSPTAGTFTPSATSLNTFYKPSAADIASGSVVISLTSSGNNCAPVVSTMTLTVTPAPTINAGADVIVCSNNPTTSLTANSTNASGILWYAGLGSYSPSTTSPTITYTLDPSEVTGGFAGLVARTTGTCPAVTDTVFIFVTPAPTVDAGPALTSCVNNPIVNITGASTSGANIAWSSAGGGTFSGGGVTINPAFSPSATEISNGTATLTLTVTTPGCLPISDVTTLTITPTPVVSAGPDRQVCSNNATVTFNGTVTNATSLIWSSNGDGTFTAPGTGLNPVYTPGPTDLTGVNVTITARSTGNGTCAQVSDVAILTVYAAPTIDAGVAGPVCQNNPLITLSGTATNATTVTWSGGAGGAFSAINNVNTTYTPTPAESVPGNITFTLTGTRAGCNNVTDNVTVNVTPQPTVNAAADRTVCANNPTLTLAGSVTNATGGIWTGGSGTFVANNTTLNAQYTPSAAEITAGTVTLTLTSTGNGNCVATNDAMTITINPAPTVDAGADRTVCGINPAVAISGTIANVGSATWSIISGGGTFANANSLSTTYNATPTDISNGFVDLRLTTTAGLCNSVFDDVHINFAPAPSANAGPNQTACTTEFPVQLNGAGSPGTWSAAGGGTFSNANALNSTFTPSAGQIAAHTAVLTYTTTATAFCPAVSSNMTITIVDGPIVNAGTPATICGTQTIIPLNGTVTNATGGIWSTTDGTGSFSSTTALNATYTVSPADVTRGSVTLVLTSSGNLQCLPVSSSVTYTLLPAIAANAGPDQSLCADVSGIQLNGSVTAATGGTWSIVAGAGTFNNANALNAIFTPTPITPGNITLRLTTTGNGSCPAQSDDVTYTITAAPTVSAGAPVTICADSAFVQLNGSFTIATGIQWSIVSGTGTFSPDNVSTNSRYIPSAADRAAGTVTLRATTTGNGTCNPVSSTMVITITPAITISAGIDQTKCANNAVTTLAASVSGGTTTGTWTSSSGNIAGFANANNPTTTYTPSATDISNTIVTLTWTATGIGTCKPASDQMIINFTPAPIVNAGLDRNSCANAITSGGVALNGSVSAGASTGIWSASSVGGSFSPNATTLNANYIPNVADTTAKTVTLTLTSTNNGTCNAVTDQMVITFTPMPVVNAGADSTICADKFAVVLAGTVANEPGGGIWSSSSGLASFLPSTIDLNGNVVPSITDRANGTLTVTLTSVPTGPCPAVSDNMVITINPAPTVNAGPDITVCANNNTVTLNGSFSIAGGVQWISNGTGTFSNSTSTSTTYNPSLIDISASPLTITLRTTGNGLCQAVSDQLTLTITPAPVVNAGPDQTICADLLGTPLNGSVTGGSTTGTWSAAPSGGTFGPDANTLNATFFPSAANKTAGSVTLTLTSTANGLCNPVTDQMIITINAAPTVNAGPDVTICADGSTTLAGTSTLSTGVTWSTAGDGTFSPNAFTPNAIYTPGTADTTAGSVTLTLTATNSGNTCNDVTDQMTITINPVPVVNAGFDRTVCADVDQLNLSPTITNATTGTWSTTGTGSFDPTNTTLNASYSPTPADVTAGSVTLTLTVTEGTCNPVTDNLSITFTPVPTISAGPDLDVCTGTLSVNVNGSATNAATVDWTIITGAGTLSSTNTLNTTYTPDPSDVSVILRLSTSGNGGCGTVDDDMEITFSATPPINAGPNQIVCTSDLPVRLNATGTTGQWQPSGGTFAPNDQTLNATYTPSAAEILAGTVTLTINTTNNGVCPAGTSSVTITINPGPTVNAGPDQTICRNVPTVTLAGTKNAVAGGTTWSTVNSSGTFNNNALLAATYSPSVADYAAGIATLVITSNSHPGCNPVTDTMKIFITPSPTLNLGSDLTRCGDVGSVNLSATATNNNSITWSIVSGAGVISNGSTNTPTYTLGAETIPGTITLQATVTPLPAAGTCNNLSQNININLTAIPTVLAGSDITTCLTSPNAVLAGTVTTATGGRWTSSGTGTFSPNANTLNATYIPSALDLTLPSIALTLTSTGNGQCLAYNDVLNLNFDPLPTISISPDRLVICSGNTVTFTSLVANATGVAWTTTGDGTFNTPTSTITIYTPGPNDISNGGMIITGTSTGPTTCAHASQNTAIGIVPSPVASINAGFDQIVCADIDTLQLNGFIAVTLGGQWSSSSGLGLFLPNDTDLSAKFIPDPSDKVGGSSITITLSSTGNGICAPSSDDMVVNFTPIPTVNAGPDMIICADSAFIQLTPTITTATGGVWTTSGDINAFAPDASTAGATYTPTPTDIANGSIGFTITTTGNGTCKAYQDAMAVTITPKPTIAIGPDLDICANATTVNLNATTTIATSTTWTTSGAGSFAPNPNNSSVYSVNPSDTTAKTITVFAQSTNQGSCKPTYDTLKINFQSTPIADAGPDISSCANLAGVNLLVGKVYNATGGTWTSSGSGTFANPASQLNNTYIPSPADKTAGTVTLTLTTTGNVKCNAIQDQMIVSIAPSPIVTANPAIICDIVNGAALTGSVTNALGGTWSSSVTGGTFAPNANSPSGITYFPAPSEITAGRAILTLTSTGNGSCNPETQSINIVIEPLPIANAGIDQFVCQGGQVTLSAFTQAGVTYQWAIAAGATFANTPNTNVTVNALTQYVLTATDAKGCSVNDTTQVDVFTMPTFTILPNPLCFDRNLVIQSNPVPVPAVNGVFQWYRNNQILNGENKTFISPPTPGTYKIEYSYGTCSVSDIGVVNTPPSVISEDVTACNNANTNLAVTNLANTTYNWTFNGNPIGGNTNNINVTTVPNDTSLYYVNITDNATTCSTLDSIYLIGIPTPIVPAIDSVSCQGLEVLLSARPTNIANLDQFLKLSYGWTKDGNTLTNTTSSLTVNQAGTYIGTVTIDRCSASGTNNIDFSEYPTSNLPEDQKYCKETDNQVILDAGQAFSYEWLTGNPADTLQTLTVSPDDNTTYKVILSNEFGCSVTDSISIRNLCEPRVFNPTAFNPGCTNCGNNGVFQVYGAHLGKYKITIFNRWGEIIFMSEDINVSWDGQYLRELMPVGVYPFIIYYEGKDEYAHIKNTIKGKVTLLR